MPLQEVSALLGHGGIQITGDVYGHLYEVQRRAVAARTEAALWG